MDSIVIGTDGSAEAGAAVRKGLDLADGIGARVTFVSVRDAISMLRTHRTHASALDALDGALAEAERRGVEADVEIVEGDRVAEILRVAHRRDADLIVIGARGPEGRVANPYGSVSAELPKHSSIPVLVVAEPDDAGVGEPSVQSA